MSTNILVIGRNEEILQTVLRLINKNPEWTASGALTDDDAFQLFDSNEFNLVLLTNGISETAEDNICSYFRTKKPSIIIVQHYGGGSGLLSNEILQALHNQSTTNNPTA